jgi:hypothetical protein
LTASRLIIERTMLVGVFVQEDASVTIDNAWITDSLPDASEEQFGRAINVQVGGRFTGRQIVIERSREIGIGVLNDGSSVDLEDLIVIDSLGQVSDDAAGHAMSVWQGASASLSRAMFASNRDVALMVRDAGSVVTGANVAIQGTEERACAATTCPDEVFGIGVGTYYGSTLSLDGFAIEDSSLCGIQLAERGQMDLTNGRVARNPIGACVQIDGYDLSRLTSGVDYLDNGISLDTTTLPIPAPGTP